VCCLAADWLALSAWQVAGVTVVEHENRRDKAISHFPSEVEQVCKDIAGFFKCAGPDKDKARARAVDALSGPSALRVLLRAVAETGGEQRLVWFNEYRLLAPGAVAAVAKRVGATSRGLIPFAENIDEDLLACGEDEHRGGVFSLGADGKPQGDELAPCLATFLEGYRDALLSRKFEFIEGCGMVARAVPARRGAPC
jgi:hypothetical protein